MLWLISDRLFWIPVVIICVSAHIAHISLSVPMTGWFSRVTASVLSGLFHFLWPCFVHKPFFLFVVVFLSKCGVLWEKKKNFYGVLGLCKKSPNSCHIKPRLIWWCHSRCVSLRFYSVIDEKWHLADYLSAGQLCANQQNLMRTKKFWYDTKQ